MRTKDNGDVLVSLRANRIDACSNLGGMMSVIIDYGIARKSGYSFKAARYSSKIGKPSRDSVGRYTELRRDSYGGKCIF